MPPNTARSWQSSSHSQHEGGNCVELDSANPGAVRDSKDPNGPSLTFPPASLATFITAIKAGALPTS